MTRTLYRLLLWLHPPAFRRRYSAEMFSIFEEAAASAGNVSLFCDAALSLLRQWIWGAGLWKGLIGALVAGLEWWFVAPLANISGGAAIQRPLAPVFNSADLAFSRALLLVFVLLVGLIGFLGVLRARTASRH